MVDLGPSPFPPRADWPTWAPREWKIADLAYLTEEDRFWLDRMLEKAELPTRCDWLHWLTLEMLH